MGEQDTPPGRRQVTIRKPRLLRAGIAPIAMGAWIGILKLDRRAAAPTLAVMTHSIQVALAQMHVEGGDLERNLRRAEELIAESAAHGAQLVLLPEAMDVGWTDPTVHAAAGPVPDGETCRRLCAAAVSHGIHVCAGISERNGTVLYNAAVLIDPQGRVLSTHRKINELEIAHDVYAKGDHISVVETEFGSVGMMICADGFARDHLISRALGYLGADIILSPCAWAVPADHDNRRAPYGGLWLDSYAPVAREFGLWIVAVSNVGAIRAGPWAGRRCIGSSLVMGPGGEAILRGPFGVDAEALLYVDIPRPPRTSGPSQWRGLFDHP